MPTQRGIKINLISQRELRIHPEFPHQESSQYTYRSPTQGQPAQFPDLDPPSTSEHSKADAILGRSSIVSVYVPSFPGERFWIRYDIDNIAAGNSKYYYFKMRMNGRWIAAWGVNSKTQPKGQVMQSLFDPSDRWNYKMSGTVYKNMGLEKRHFYFNAEPLGEEAAGAHGGHIEVMAYRAQNRRRKMPDQLPEFKNQQDCGILMPTNGLVDAPQDAQYFDWLLSDPKDKPYVTFKFYYRNWDSLQELQIIPEQHPRTLLRPTPSLMSINGMSRELQEHLDREEEPEPTKRSHEFTTPGRESSSSINSNTPWMTTVFDESPTQIKQRRGSQRQEFVKSLERGPVSKFSSALIDKPTAPKGKKDSKKHHPAPAAEGYLNRPLPDIPDEKTYLRRSHSRRSSGASSSASITPSLRSWADRDSRSPEPPEICIAHVLHIGESSAYPRHRDMEIIRQHRDERLSRNSSSGDASELTDSSNSNIPHNKSSRPSTSGSGSGTSSRHQDSDGGKKKRSSTPHPDAPSVLGGAKPKFGLKLKGLSRKRHSRNGSSSLENHLEQQATPIVNEAFSPDETLSISAIENPLEPPVEESIMVFMEPETPNQERVLPRSKFSIGNVIHDISNVTIRSKRRTPSKSPVPLATMMATKPKTETPLQHHKSTSASPPKDDDELSTMDNQTTLSLTESEWMCKTPSPIRNQLSPVKVNDAQDLESNAQSLGSNDTKENLEVMVEPEDDLTPNRRRLRKRAMTWYDKVRAAADIEEAGGSPTRYDGAGGGTGSPQWI